MKELEQINIDKKRLQLIQHEGNKARLERLKNVVLSLPSDPGIYQYIDYTGKIIYVGKAKNLKRRVYSYFSKEHEPGKTRLLVSKIAEIYYIVVKTEHDALLLENNLIKQYRPKYNVLLKDDKTYPYIWIPSEPFARIKTSRIKGKSGHYFGPYSQINIMYVLLNLIREIYPLRTCNLNLAPNKISEGKYRVCLDYHIEKCAGPCVGKQSLKAYNKNLEEIIDILNGKTRQLTSKLKKEMLSLADELRFEEAEEIKKKILLLEKYRAKSEVVSYTYNDIDVFSIDQDGDEAAFINYLHIVNGAISRAFTFEYKKKMNECKEDLLSLGIIEMRSRFKSKAKEIIIPFNIDIDLGKVEITIPQRGDKKQLLDLSLLNVKQYRVDRMKQKEKLNPQQRGIKLMTELQTALQLKTRPKTIECFDNSNISGESAVAACVVFVMGKPSKKDYRKYTIKTVEGPDDYASMREVVERRYSRLVEEKKPLPDLIIADGGKGQMEAIRSVIVDRLHLTIPIAGLAKDGRHRTSEFLYGSPARRVGIKPQTPLFNLMEQIQDEVHRFAITFHRDIRSKKQIHSELDDIKGIGPKTKELLLDKYKTVKRIKEATLEELNTVIGKSKAAIIFKQLTQ